MLSICEVNKMNEIAPEKSEQIKAVTVTVCSECLTASCWHGEFMCDGAKYADIKEMPKSELKKLGLEHPSHWDKSSEWGERHEV